MRKQQSNGPDIVAMITKMQEQLAALDRKLDALITKPQPQPKPPSQPPKHDHQPGRQMYKATCADCKKDCEIPFKPMGDRPVYCQDCFRRRKTANNLKVVPDNKPKVTSPVQTVITPTGIIQAPIPKEKKKPVAARKAALKKKPAAKKK
jgi:CxxC-x17-CxxC domain-containing protein